MNSIEQEITNFQAVIEDAFDTRVSSLRDEIARLSDIRDKCDGWVERYLSWTPPTTDNQPKNPSGKLDLSQFDNRHSLYIYVFGETLPRRRVHASSKEHWSKKQVSNLYNSRKENLEKLINLSEKYLGGFESHEKKHAVTQYLIYKHKEYNWKGDGNLAHPYWPDLVAPEKQADFLIMLHHTDQAIARSLLSLLAHKSGSPIIMHATTKNNYEKLVQVLSESDVIVSEEITAWYESLNLRDIKDIDDLLATLGSIHKDFFLMNSVEPLDNFGEAMETISYKEWPNIDDGTAHETSKSSLPNTYQEPDKEEKEQYFMGLRSCFKDTRILNSIVDALCDQDINCIDAEDKDLLFYRLSGNNKPDVLTKVRWHTKYSNKPGEKNKTRHPNELYYLLSNMYEPIVSEIQIRVMNFFEFEDETYKLVKSAFKDEETKSKSGIRTKGQSAQPSFQETMHGICQEGFPVKRRK